MATAPYESIYIDANYKFHVLRTTGAGDSINTKIFVPAVENPQNPGEMLPNLSAYEYEVYLNGRRLSPVEYTLGGWDDAGTFRLSVTLTNGNTFESGDYVVVLTQTRLTLDDITFGEGQRINAGKLNSIFKRFLDKLEELKAVGVAFASNTLFDELTAAVAQAAAEMLSTPPGGSGGWPQELAWKNLQTDFNGDLIAALNSDAQFIYVPAGTYNLEPAVLYVYLTVPLKYVKCEPGAVFSAAQGSSRIGWINGLPIADVLATVVFDGAKWEGVDGIWLGLDGTIRLLLIDNTATTDMYFVNLGYDQPKVRSVILKRYNHSARLYIGGIDTVILDDVTINAEYLNISYCNNCVLNDVTINTQNFVIWKNSSCYIDRLTINTSSMDVEADERIIVRHSTIAGTGDSSIKLESYSKGTIILEDVIVADCRLRVYTVGRIQLKNVRANGCTDTYITGIGTIENCQFVNCAAIDLAVSGTISGCMFKGFDNVAFDPFDATEPLTTLIGCHIESSTSHLYLYARIILTNSLIKGNHINIHVKAHTIISNNRLFNCEIQQMYSSSPMYDVIVMGNIVTNDSSIQPWFHSEQATDYIEEHNLVISA